MTDLSFDAADITAAIQKNLEGFDPSVESGTVGRILEVGDGIARVSGLPNASVNEILEFESGDVGLASTSMRTQSVLWYWAMLKTLKRAKTLSPPEGFFLFQ